MQHSLLFELSKKGQIELLIVCNCKKLYFKRWEISDRVQDLVLKQVHQIALRSFVFDRFKFSTIWIARPLDWSSYWWLIVLQLDGHTQILQRANSNPDVLLSLNYVTGSILLWIHTNVFSETLCLLTKLLTIINCQRQVGKVNLVASDIPLLKHLVMYLKMMSVK